MQTDQHRLSYSQLSKWMECEAAAYAEYVTKTWQQTDRTAFMLGRYFEAVLFGDLQSAELELQRDIQADARVLTQKRGAATADRLAAEAAVVRARAQPALVAYLEGDHWAEMSCTIHGVRFKCILDVLHLERGRIVDVKYVKDLNRTWCERDGRNVKLPWWRAWGYEKQQAIYREAVLQTHGVACDTYLLPVTKQKPADYDLLGPFGPPGQLERILDDLAEPIARAIELKEQKDEPIRCEKSSCDYCRETRFISGPMEVRL